METEAAAAFKEMTLVQLALDAPLMSTRRSWSSSGTNRISRSSSTKPRVATNKDANERVPFSWERSPGVPKEARKTALDAYAESLPWPPKLPPSRWRPAEDMTDHGLEPSYGDGNDGAIDVSSNGSNEEEEEEEEDTFSDILDEASLCEKFDVACRLSSFDSSAVRDVERLVHRAPSFIMKRFLPAANALANSSAHGSTGARPKRSEARAQCSACRQQKESRMPSTVAHVHSTPSHASNNLRAPSVPYLDDQAELPSKSCGLMLFFPWSLKPTVCGFKSPARSRTPRATSLASIRVPRCSTGDGWRPHQACSEVGNGDGAGVCLVDKPSGRPACRPPRWGLSFLDTSRLRIGGRDAERWISTAKARRGEGAGERSGTRRNGVDPGAIWNLPQLRSPSESWLTRALRSPDKIF